MTYVRRKGRRVWLPAALAFLVVLAATLGVACMIGPTASDAGTPEAGTATVGDQCTAVVTELANTAAAGAQ